MKTTIFSLFLALGFATGCTHTSTTRVISNDGSGDAVYQRHVDGPGGSEDTKIIDPSKNIKDCRQLLREGKYRPEMGLNCSSAAAGMGMSLPGAYGMSDPTFIAGGMAGRSHMVGVGPGQVYTTEDGEPPMTRKEGRAVVEALDDLKKEVDSGKGKKSKK